MIHTLIGGRGWEDSLLTGGGGGGGGGGEGVSMEPPVSSKEVEEEDEIAKWKDDSGYNVDGFGHSDRVSGNLVWLRTTRTRR